MVRLHPQLRILLFEVMFELMFDNLFN